MASCTFKCNRCVLCIITPPNVEGGGGKGVNCFEKSHPFPYSTLQHVSGLSPEGLVVTSSSGNKHNYYAYALENLSLPPSLHEQRAFFHALLQLTTILKQTNDSLCDLTDLTSIFLLCLRIFFGGLPLLVTLFPTKEPGPRIHSRSQSNPN